MQISVIIFLVIMFFGILLVMVGIIENNYKCQPQIIYRYIPRSFIEEQNEPVYPEDIFKVMFTSQSPFIYSVQRSNIHKKEKIKKYLVDNIEPK